MNDVFNHLDIAMHNDYEDSPERDDHDYEAHDVDPPSVPQASGQGGDTDRAPAIRSDVATPAPPDAGADTSPPDAVHDDEQRIDSETIPTADPNGSATVDLGTDPTPLSSVSSALAPQVAPSWPSDSPTAPSAPVAESGRPPRREELARTRAAERESKKKRELERVEQNAQAAGERERLRLQKARRAVKAAESRRRQVEREAHRRDLHRANIRLSDEILNQLARCRPDESPSLRTVIDALPDPDRAVVEAEVERRRTRRNED